MHIKQSLVLWVLYPFIFCLASTLFAPDQTKDPITPKDPTLELPPGVTEEQMKEFEKALDEIIAGLDQETLDYLTALGEQMIQEAEAAGMNPFEYIEKQAELGQLPDIELPGLKPPQQPAIQQPPVQTPTKPLIPPADAVRTQTVVQELIASLLAYIHDIRQKAASDADLAREINPFKYRLDDLVYYLHMLQNPRLSQLLTQKEFSTLFELLSAFGQELSLIAARFEVPEFDIFGKDPYVLLKVSKDASNEKILEAFSKASEQYDPIILQRTLRKENQPSSVIEKQLERARTKNRKLLSAYERIRQERESRFILDEILNLLVDYLEQKKLLDELKQILQKFEPEALKIKQERDKLEESARRAQDEVLRKRPIVSRIFDMPAARDVRSGAGRDTRPGSGGAGLPPAVGGKPTDGKKPTDTSSKKPGEDGKKPPIKKPDDKKKDEKDKKKKEEKAKKKADEKSKAAKTETAPEVIKKIAVLEEEFKNLEKLIDDNKEEFKKLKEFLLKSGDDLTTEENFKTAEKYLQLISSFSSSFQKMSSMIKKVIADFKGKPTEKQYKAEVQKLINAFEKKFPGLMQLFANINATAGTVITEEGLKQRLPKPVNPQKALVFFGIDKPENTGEGFDKLRKLNQPNLKKPADTLSEEDKKLQNPIKMLQENILTFKKTAGVKVQEEKKPQPPADATPAT